MKYRQKINGQWSNWINFNIKALDGMPIGSIIMFAGETIPTGWLICDGDTLNEEEYPELYDVIGHTYGGSGLDFNLPDFRGRAGFGYHDMETGMYPLGNTGGTKSHTHQYGFQTNGWYGTLTENFALWNGSSWVSQGGSAGTQSIGTRSGQDMEAHTPATLTAIADTGSSGTLPPYIVVNYIIKATNTTPTMASVVNATNNSTEDTYSCDYENKHYGGVVLYENSTGTTGNITLSDNVSNYNCLEIEYSKDGYSKCTGKLSNYSSPMLDLFWYWYDSGRGIVVYENLCEIPTISGATITRGDIYYTDIANNAIASGRGLGGTSIKITRVVGYK